MTGSRLRCRRCGATFAVANLSGSPRVTAVLPDVIERLLRGHIRRSCRNSCAMCYRPLTTDAQIIQSACSRGCADSLRSGLGVA